MIYKKISLISGILAIGIIAIVTVAWLFLVHSVTVDFAPNAVFYEFTITPENKNSFKESVAQKMSELSFKLDSHRRDSDLWRSRNIAVDFHFNEQLGTVFVVFSTVQKDPKELFRFGTQLNNILKNKVVFCLLFICREYLI